MEKVEAHLKDLCDKYGFATRFFSFKGFFYCEVYSENLLGEDTLWFEIKTASLKYDDEEPFLPKIKVYGNTKDRNIYLSKTRKDLSQKDILDFLKKISEISGYRLVCEPTDKDYQISVESFIDLKDFQDIGNNKGYNEQDVLFSNLNKENEVLDKLFYNDFYIWKNYLINDKKDFKDESLIRDIRENINNGLYGIEIELDSLRDEYAKKNEENPYYEDLDTLWDCFNWYMDYLNNDITLETFSDLVNQYLNYEPRKIEINGKEV